MGTATTCTDWLNDYIFPVEAKWDDRAVAAAARLGLCEMIASGVTCIADMYMRTGVVAQRRWPRRASAPTCPAAGSSSRSPSTGEEPRLPGPEGPHRGVGTATTGGRIRIDCSIHGEYTSHAGLWDWDGGLRRRARPGDACAPVETGRSTRSARRATGGKTPAAVLAGHGVFDVRAIAAHCVWTSPGTGRSWRRRGSRRSTTPCPT